MSLKRRLIFLACTLLLLSNCMRFEVFATATSNNASSPDCTCSSGANANLSAHQDSCERKQYIRTLFEGISASDIYASWNTYSSDIQSDILEMLEVYDSVKFDTLKALIDGNGNNTELTTQVGGISLSVQGSIPNDVSLAASIVGSAFYHADLASFIELDSVRSALDISLSSPSGEWQPSSGPMRVSLSADSLGFSDGDYVAIVHDHKGTLEDLGIYIVENGILTFETESFSTFYFGVIFVYDGFEYQISGGSQIALSELMNQLGINRPVSAVQSVYFSNPTVLEVTKVENDWLLTSLESFGTEETLTITFSDGSEIDILVSDPVYYNYAVSSANTNVPLLATKNYTVGTVTAGDTSAKGKKFKANSTAISTANVQAAGTTSSTATTLHMAIYVRAGTAVRFATGVTFPSGTSRPTASSSSIWYYAKDSSANYVIAKADSGGKSATFPVRATVNSKTYYCNVVLHVVDDAAPVLLKDALAASPLADKYEIKTLNSTLYNYDGYAFNANYNNTDQPFIAFFSASLGVNASSTATNAGWKTSSIQANGGGATAKMGILKPNLADGLPVFSQGQQTGMFTLDALSGKVVYPDVDFQFIYNKETGYYTYNSSLNHAQFNASTNEIELYQQSLSPADSIIAAAHGNAGFYPFADINQAITNAGYTPLTWTQWDTKLSSDFVLTPSQYARDIVNSASTNPVAVMDMHYGVHICEDFYLPEGRTVNGNELEFRFTGDDDLWVFIDGHLVLDIGGGHSALSGTFNITTGDVWIESYAQLAAADGGYYATQTQGKDLRFKSDVLTSLEEDQMHTIQIFYLERHASVSNCYIHFNLPLAPTSGVNISKALENQDGLPLSVTPDVDYTFQIFVASDDDDVINATNFAPLANTAYTTITGTTRYTDADGYFTIKAGETVYFDGIPRFSEVYVVEHAPTDHYIYTESLLSINGASAVPYVFDSQSETKVVQKSGPVSFAFTNRMQTYPLTIEKEVIGGANALPSPDTVFDFALEFADPISEKNGASIETSGNIQSVTLQHNGTRKTVSFSLGHDQSLSIPRVPANLSFNLAEQEISGFDTPAYAFSDHSPVEVDYADSFAAVIQNKDSNTVLVTNQRVSEITLTKEITIPAAEDQTFYFQITGTSKNNTRKQITVPIVVQAGSTFAQQTIVVTDLVSDIYTGGSITIAEVNLPGGYVLSFISFADKVFHSPENNEITVTAADFSANMEISFVNERVSVPGTGITIYKSLSFNGDLRGWTFSVTDSTGAEIDGSPFVTDELGMIVISDLLPGEYAVTELLPADGPYRVEGNATRIAVVEDGSMYCLEYTNHLVAGQLTINKIDQAGNPIPGVTVLLEWSTDGTTWYPVFSSDVVTPGGCQNLNIADGTLTTDETGFLSFPMLDSTLQYRLTEIACPQDYLLLADPIFVGLLPEESKYELHFDIVNASAFTFPDTGIRTLPVIVSFGSSLVVVSSLYIWIDDLYSHKYHATKRGGKK